MDNKVVKLNIVPKPLPNTRTIMEPSKDLQGPFFSGTGNIDYVCGNCGYVIAKGLEEGQIRNIVVHCPKCRMYNEFPP